MNKNQNIIGREVEKVVLDRALSSKDPELVAVYGRRRIGKTFLIREYLKHNIVFEVAGMHEQNTISQLAGFHAALRRAFPTVASVQPRTWLDAFEILRTCLEQAPKQKHKRVIFFDEFPWLATRKSNFLAAFENFWNDYGSRHRDLVVVICGSAAAWMIRNVVNARGGLYNRLTRRMRLEPFNLNEVEL
ncbi:MAG: AAA family ATPase, partial [Pirellula sp.]